MLCLDGEKMMDTKAIESYVENFINNNSSGAFPSLAVDSDATNHFMYNRVVFVPEIGTKTTEKNVFTIVYPAYAAHRAAACGYPPCRADRRG